MRRITKPRLCDHASCLLDDSMREHEKWFGKVTRIRCSPDVEARYRKDFERAAKRVTSGYEQLVVDGIPVESDISMHPGTTYIT